PRAVGGARPRARRRQSVPPRPLPQRRPFFFSSRRRHTRFSRDWSSDVCSSDLIPWEAPLTHMYGQPLRGTTVGVATELEVAGALDPGDLDPIAVHPLPAQERILAAFANLGFRFHSADCEKGRIWGVHQELPFYQEIELYPPS